MASAAVKVAAVIQLDESSLNPINGLSRFFLSRVDALRLAARLEASSIPLTLVRVFAFERLSSAYCEERGTARSCTSRKASRPSGTFLLRFRFVFSRLANSLPLPYRVL